MLKKTFKLINLFTFFAVLFVFAVSAEAQDSYKKKLTKTYVAEGEVDFTQLLPPPPQQGSTANQQEVKELLQWQSQRTSEQIALAQADQDINVFRFQDVLGSNFQESKLPETAKFFSNAVGNAEILVNQAKKYFHRPRPYIADDRILPILDKPNNDSYPSGHSIGGHFFALLLADMVPEKAEAIYARGDQYALNRIIGGVHYPSDVEAGKLCAVTIAERMFTSAEFRKDFEKARLEVREALGLN